MQAKPCEHLIVSQKTGNKISIKPTKVIRIQNNRV